MRKYKAKKQMSMEQMGKAVELLYSNPNKKKVDSLAKIQKQVDNIEAVNSGNIPDNFNFDKFFKEL